MINPSRIKNDSKHKCYFKGFKSSRKYIDLNWHKETITHIILKKHITQQVENYHARKRTREIILEKLGRKGSKRKVYRWCSKRTCKKI